MVTRNQKAAYVNPLAAALGLVPGYPKVEFLFIVEVRVEDHPRPLSN